MAGNALDEGGSVVPLRQRAQYQQWARVGVAAIAAVTALLAGIDTQAMLWSVGPLAVVVVLGQPLSVIRSSGPVMVRLTGALLLLDGLALTWLVLRLGDGGSPVIGLVLLHVVAVTLLASHRTGVKLGIWYALLLMLGHEAAQAALLPGVEATGDNLVGGAILAVVAALATGMSSLANERELRRSRHGLQQLADFSARVQSLATPLEIAHAILEEVTELLGGEAGLIVTADDGHVLSSTPGINTQGGPIAASQLLSTVVRERHTLLSANLPTGRDGWLARAMRGRNLVAIPVLGDESVRLVLVTTTDVPQGSRIAARLLRDAERTVAYGALAYVNAELRAELDHAATTDGLTGVSNRAVFDRELEREMARSDRDGTPLSLVIVDVDHFKAFNDDFGHQVGDEVLRGVAQCLASNARLGDVVARYGGEEFVLLMPNTPADKAALVANRHRKRLATVPSPRPITASMGVATTIGHAVDAVDYVEAADAALYRAKEAGRNRVVVSHLRDLGVESGVPS